MVTRYTTAANARIALVAFVTAGAVALLCTPGAWGSKHDTNLLVLQMSMAGLCFCAAAVYRHRTRVYGDRPGERTPIELRRPRRAERDVTSLIRTFAALAMVLTAAYGLGLIGLLIHA